MTIWHFGGFFLYIKRSSAPSEFHYTSTLLELRMNCFLVLNSLEFDVYRTLVNL
jgi:hypothetical protein